MSKRFKPHLLPGDPNEKALARNAERSPIRRINKLGLQVNSQFYPQCLLDYADSLPDLEGEQFKRRLRQLSPNGEPYEFPGYTHRYDDKAKTWQQERFKTFDPTQFQSLGLKAAPFPVIQSKAATSPRIPSPDRELQAAQAAEVSRLLEEEEAERNYWDNMTPDVLAAQDAECSRLVAEMEAADRAKKKNEAFSDMPAAEPAAQEDVSLRLRHEDQATRS